MTFDIAYWRKAPCSCGECTQAGVSHLEVVRDGNTHELLHGYRLLNWYLAREHALSLFKQAKPKEMR